VTSTVLAAPIRTQRPSDSAGANRHPAQAGRLSPTAALFLLASIVVSFLAASSAPTPLYAVYQAAWGFTPITTTVVFGVYALAVLAALLTVGKLSDHVGRRPVLLVALGLAAISMVVFATADSVTALFIGRVLQGLSTGAAVAAVGAGLLDISRSRGTLANAVAPMTGSATGGLLSGLLVQYLPDPTKLVYLVLLAVFALQAVGVVLMTETVTPKAGALASLRPEIQLPRRLRGAVLVAAPVLVAVWALGGLYGSLGPALVGRVVGSSSLSLGGLALFTLAGSAALTVLLTRNVAPARVMSAGIVALIAGVVMTLAAISADSAVGFFVGSAVAGVGFGGGFQGGIRIVIPSAAPHERAGVLSLLYIVSYLALGLPAVIGGVLVVHGGGLLDTAREYGIAVIVFAGLALIGLAGRGRRPLASVN
jgi:predicted MFS family arabinose efflux permease